MGFRRLLDRVLARQAEGIVAVPVPSVASLAAPAPGFVPNEVYLEVRIRQMWLTNERELWREYQPFGAVVTEFIRQGQRVAIPSVLGSAELTRRFNIIGADDAVEFGNIRVAGPVPYEGDDVSLLLALFRVKTADLLIRSLTLIEDVAGVVGFSGLAAAAPLASALIRGIESCLDAKDAELRVGAYCSWSSPSGPTGDASSATELAPMHYAILRRPRIGVTPAELAALRVKDGRLHRLTDGVLVPYSEHDFILISIDARRFREDYRQLDFYRLWEQAKQRLIDGDLAAGRRLWRQASGAIFSDDLTRPQQQVLFAEYERLYADLVERFATRGASAYRGGTRSADVSLEDDDPAAILRRAMG
jgi:hypothetical protein